MLIAHFEGMRFSVNVWKFFFQPDPPLPPPPLPTAAAAGAATGPRFFPASVLFRFRRSCWVTTLCRTFPACRGRRYRRSKTWTFPATASVPSVTWFSCPGCGASTWKTTRSTPYRWSSVCAQVRISWHIADAEEYSTVGIREGICPAWLQRSNCVPCG